MPRTKLSVPDVAAAGPALWSNADAQATCLFIFGDRSGQPCFPVHVRSTSKAGLRMGGDVQKVH